MAANHSVDEIRKYLNADSLHHLSKEGMVKATGKPAESFCMACSDGKYPVPYEPVLDIECGHYRQLGHPGCV